MVCRATNFTPFRLLFGAKAVLPDEAEEKDLLESDRLKAVTNLQKYQDETRN
jgi:hypothetical protein